MEYCYVKLYFVKGACVLAYDLFNITDISLYAGCILNLMPAMLTTLLREQPNW